jgi:hypothetical protein
VAYGRTTQFSAACSAMQPATVYARITDHTFAAKSFENHRGDVVVAYKLGIWHANFELSMQA